MKKALKEPLDNAKDVITSMDGMQASITDPINKLMDEDIYNVIQKFIDSIVDQQGLLSCSTLNDMFKSIGDFACCDLMNDVIALSAASYIYIIIIILIEY